MDKEQRRAWGPLIREARKAAQLDQETLAQMAGTTRRTVGSIERGDTVAQRDVLERILGALGLTPLSAGDPDVENFLAMLRPLLQRLDVAERESVMPEIVELVAEALQRPRRRGNVVTLKPKSSEADPNVAHLIDEPSAAAPEPRNDVEPDEEPEGP